MYCDGYITQPYYVMSFSWRFYPKTKQETLPLEQCGIKGLAQGPNSCADFIMATPGIEPPALRVQVK